LTQKGLLIIIIFLFIGTSVSPSIARNNIQKSNLFTLDGNHAPIRIIGNEQFTEENGVTGGNGTVDDPYIIENWVIVSDGSASQGIFINNTDVYFVIRNCTISGFHHPDEYRQGIELSEVTHGTIESTIISECQTGISIRYSKENIIYNCTCFNYSALYGYGIGIHLSNNIAIISCRCYTMYTGIDISRSSEITVKNTVCINNTDSGLVSSAGEPTSMRFFIENCTFEKNDYYGIWLIDREQHPSYFTICNCSFNYNYIGMSLQSLSNNLIENCVFYNNSVGLSFDIKAKNNIIRNCSFLSNTPYGISIQGVFIILSFAPNNEISYCDFVDNVIGLILYMTRGNKIHHCNITNNSYMGISSFFSIALIHSNNFVNNGRNYPIAPDPAGVYSWFSFLNVQNNWWNASKGPCISLLIEGVDKWKVIKLRTVDDADTVMFRHGFAYFRPWLSEPVPDAGKQT